MYPIGEISNRDVGLLYEYRILKQPSDFLSAIYSDSEGMVYSIQEGNLTNFKTESDESVYSYKLGFDTVANKIPYLEFRANTTTDKRRLANILYLDGDTLYSLSPGFEQAVQVTLYWVDSLDVIKNAIEDYKASLLALNLDKLKEFLETKKNQPTHQTTISGRDQNLLEISGSDMVDSDYMITTALDSQLLVNPSQDLLMSLPRRLKHNINISITDGKTRYLSSFSGYTINIQGNCDWVIRDVDSGIDFVNGNGKVYLRNCKLVHFRTAISSGVMNNHYTCTYLHAHRSLIVRNQGFIDDIYLTGGSTLLDVPNPISTLYPTTYIKKVSLIGYGCSVYSWAKPIAVDTSAILGLAWWLSPSTKQTALYIAGRRIDEVGGAHDAELHPTQVVEYNVDNIHIHTGGE